MKPLSQKALPEIKLEPHEVDQFLNLSSKEGLLIVYLVCKGNDQNARWVYFTLIKYLASLFAMLILMLKLMPSRDLNQTAKKPIFLTYLCGFFLNLFLFCSSQKKLSLFCLWRVNNYTVAGGSLNP